jgi:hypothetical protein
MLPSERLNLAKTLLSRPNARYELFNVDGSVNRAALARAIDRQLELDSALDGYDRSSKVGKDKPRKTWVGLKSATPGRRSGHRGDDAEKRAIAARKKGRK